MSKNYTQYILFNLRKMAKAYGEGGGQGEFPFPELSTNETVVVEPTQGEQMMFFIPRIEGGRIVSFRSPLHSVLVANDLTNSPLAEEQQMDAVLLDHQVETPAGRPALSYRQDAEALKANDIFVSDRLAQVILQGGESLIGKITIPAARGDISAFVAHDAARGVVMITAPAVHQSKLAKYVEELAIQSGIIGVTTRPYTNASGEVTIVAGERHAVMGAIDTMRMSSRDALVDTLH